MEYLNIKKENYSDNIEFESYQNLLFEYIADIIISQHPTPEDLCQLCGLTCPKDSETNYKFFLLESIRNNQLHYQQEIVFDGIYLHKDIKEISLFNINDPHIFTILSRIVFHNCDFYFQVDGKAKRKYDNCNFNKGVMFYSISNDDQSIDAFSQCKTDSILFSNNRYEDESKFKNYCFKSDNLLTYTFKYIKCQFLFYDIKMVMNDNTIFEDNVFFTDVIFGYDKIESTLILNTLNLSNNVFEKKVSFSSITAQKLHITKNTFKDSFVINNSNFGVANTASAPASIRAELSPVSQLSSNFFERNVFIQKCVFNNGLDLTMNQFMIVPYFFDVRVSQDLTGKETFLIIKHALDLNSNRTEANNFFAQEMYAYEKELTNTDHWQKKIILKINRATSDYGQNYVKPILLIFGFMLFNALMMLGYNYNWLYKIISPTGIIAKGIYGLNHFFASLLPARIATCHGFEFIGFWLNIIYSILIYQTIVALKRHTKR